jgi:hypothetical protein
MVELWSIHQTPSQMDILHDCDIPVKTLETLHVEHISAEGRSRGFWVLNEDEFEEEFEDEPVDSFSRRNRDDSLLGAEGRLGVCALLA